MKNYDETIDVVFNRINQYNEKKSRRNAAMKRAAIPVCCLCLAALTGFGILNGFQPEPDPDQTLDDALYPGIDDTVDPDEITSTPATNDKIIINQIEAAPNYDRCLWALMYDDFVDLNSAQLMDYFGINIFPEIPEDLSIWEDQRVGLFRRNGGTGEVYWDQVVLNFSNADYTRLINLSIQKKFIFPEDYLIYTMSETLSVIGGTEVVICLLNDGCYYAEFMYHDVCFRLSSEGLSQDEFVAVISSLVS